MGSEWFHKHPKELPSKARKPLTEVNQNMQLCMSQQGIEHGNEEEATDYLETLQNDIGNLNESSSKSYLPTDGIYGKNILSEDALRQKHLINDLKLDTKHILLGAAWIDEEAWQEFMHYPEVLFIDSTHGTNNESHPLLNLVGKDSNSKVFPLVRIFMPNETASFYRWAFLEALPTLL
jgi:hypothetical protein